MEYPMLHQAYQFVHQNTQRGVTQLQLSKAFSINKLESRQICRNLEKRGVVKRILKDMGKQRVQV